MEPLVIFSAGLVVFCGYIALIDAINDLKHGKAAVKKEVAEKRRYRARTRQPIFSAHRREGGAGVHWQGPLAGSF